jgi:hypothetical protein
MFNDIMKRIFGWSDWLRHFLGIYANYFALGLLLVMAAKVFKIKLNYNIGGK